MSERSNVRVAVRVRPMNQQEKNKQSYCVISMKGNKTILQNNVSPNTSKVQKHKVPKEFNFDHCFWSADDSDPDSYAGQEEVFKTLREGIIENIYQGYNVCIFAYGQTGSGKTYSMMGTDDEPGLIPRFCSALLNRTSDCTLRVELSYMEIYNEKVRDLLQLKKSKKELSVREHKILGPYVEGLSQHAVSTWEDIKLLLVAGNKYRTTAATKMNEQSSRSHSIFTLNITQIFHNQESDTTKELHSKFNLVDLAGSERASKSGAQGKHLEESANINRSLTSLGRVMSSLAEGKIRRQSYYVSYRESVLTWLLKNSLGGNSKTVMLATISPAEDNYGETHSTLVYAERARKIINEAIVNEDTKFKAVVTLQEEVQKLKEKLKHAKSQQTQELKLQIKESENLLKQLNLSWEEKLKKTEENAKVIQKYLESMGISVDASGIKCAKDQCCLFNLNPDPKSNEYLLYYLAAHNKIGDGSSQDFKLSGPGIKEEHCVITMTPDGDVFLVPNSKAETRVNGTLVQERIQLYHEDKINLGFKYSFMLNQPNKKQLNHPSENTHKLEKEKNGEMFLSIINQSNPERESDIQEPCLYCQSVGRPQSQGNGNGFTNTSHINASQMDTSTESRLHDSQALCSMEKVFAILTEMQQNFQTLVDKLESKHLINQQDCEDMNMMKSKTFLNITGQKNAFKELLANLKMEAYQYENLSLSTFLQIGTQSIKAMDTCSTETLAWNFFHKIIALNGTARNTSIINDKSYEDFLTNDLAGSSIHPLDVLCVILHCSDHFLQQEIFTKMSLCQFAVPLLLPDTDGLNFTFMLWVMRDIIKHWRPESLSESKGFKEENLVQISMPTFSFVRLGKSKLSKSKILNQVLSPAHLNHNWFVHDNMEGGNGTRTVSDGLLEITWYFPAGNRISDIFLEPVAVTNLRGNLESNIKQFEFLTHISSAIFIFIQTINADQYELLMKYRNANTNVVLIIMTTNEKLDENTKDILKRSTFLKFNKGNTESEFVKMIRLTLNKLMKNNSNYHSIEDMADIAHRLGISIDENVKECQDAKVKAKAITVKIVDVVEYKRETMKLQGETLKELARLEKEMCQMKRQGNDSSEHYKSKLIQKSANIRQQQYDCEVPSGIENFIKAIKDKNSLEKQYFLKWIRIYLDSTARQNHSDLQDEYKKKNKTASKEILSALDKKMSESSLGVEHFLRELSQFYEAENFAIKDINKRKFRELPGIAADLLLDGFPLELIDGDASNIPLQWITDVLTQLDKKTGNTCRIRAITVLGVQSTGKSTLLNTMFGLQFPVSNGRCTRGAFMSLIKVEEDFQLQLGCEFILVIDTEGLKAPELASLDDSYEHDNELATLVVGLSDITIFNMAMENTTEMKETLQIVVHAFLRMKEVGKRPNCQFVHQNVSDVSAHEMNRRGRQRLLEQLNDMTGIAANMEKKNTVTTFSDIMEYDPETHNWYIPGLWHGVPPMAPVNTGYSNSIHELKKHLIEIMQKGSAIYISDYITWISSLWNAVKHENFIFSFRNSLVAKAYKQLAKKYSELEWEFDKKMLEWLTRTETAIKNQSLDTVEQKGEDCIKDAYAILSREEEKMKSALEGYFNKETELVHLIEKYREDFFNSIKHHKRKHEMKAISKAKEAVVIQKEKHKIQHLQDSYIEMIENKVSNLLEDCRKKQKQPTKIELTQTFQMMWTVTVSELDITPLKRYDIEKNMLCIITEDMKNNGSAVNQKLQKIKNLPKSESKHNWSAFTVNAVKILSFRVPKVTAQEDHFLNSVLDACSKYVKKQINQEDDYNDAYCWELLKIINNMCELNDEKGFPLDAEKELDIKLCALGSVVEHFQHMHDVFIRKNDPLRRLTALKPAYLATFINMFQEKDESFNRAELFCDCCIKPALVDQINRILGIKIVDNFLSEADSQAFKDRTFFQYELLSYLIQKKNAQHYIKYTLNYEQYAKAWIQHTIANKYQNMNSLPSQIVSDAIQKIKEVLRDPEILACESVSDFLRKFCSKLDEELAFNQDKMKVIVFQTKVPIKEFASSICKSLDATEEELKLEMKHQDSESVLSKLTIKPEDELFQKVIGCGKQCPFCKVPCEAGATEHKKHFATIHRPQGLGRYRNSETNILVHEICSTSVVSNKTFMNSDTEDKYHPYRDYCTYYPDWAIQPDPSIDASDYWKFILKEFNKEFAEMYEAKPAEIPDTWQEITEEQAIESLKKTFNMQ